MPSSRRQRYGGHRSFWRKSLSQKLISQIPQTTCMVLMPYFDMQVRLAEPDDAIAVARVHVRSWQVAYRTLLPDDYLNQLRPEDRAQKYDFASLDALKP